MFPEKQKLTHKQLMAKLELIIFDLRPFEEIRIKKDEYGKPGKIIILTSGTTLLDFNQGEEIQDRRVS